jgi:hypothetical protein
MSIYKFLVDTDGETILYYAKATGVYPKSISRYALSKYLRQNFKQMYGIWDEIDAEIKEDREAINQRKNAVNTFNDEEVKISKILDDVKEFVDEGNVSDFRRNRNKMVRQAIRDKNKLREREIKKKIRELEKQKNKESVRKSDKINPFKH